MMQLKYILGLLFVCSFLFASAQNKVERHMNAREGDQAYAKGAFQDAEIKYREANQLERKSTTTYNLGNSVFQQERYEEAVKHYQDAVEEAADPQLKAQAYHNLGNAHLSNENLEEGVKSYIESLKLNPDDMDTKKNLTMALQKLEQQRQQQQQQQEQQNQEQQEQEQQEQQQQDPSQQPQQQPQQGEEEMPQDAQPQEEKRDLSKEEAEELLKIIEDEDQKVQEKLRKTSGEKKKPKKDW
jgi:tetratricopeptide (TPR) repeat protein